MFKLQALTLPHICRLQATELKFCNKGITVQAICLRYFQKLLKESLVFRTCLVAGSFLLRLKTIAMFQT